MNTKNETDDGPEWVISNTTLLFPVSYFAGFTFWRHRAKYGWLGRAKRFASEKEALEFTQLYLPPLGDKGYEILPLSEKLIRISQPEDEEGR